MSIPVSGELDVKQQAIMSAAYRLSMAVNNLKSIQDLDPDEYRATWMDTYAELFEYNADFIRAVEASKPDEPHPAHPLPTPTGEDGGA